MTLHISAICGCECARVSVCSDTYSDGAWDLGLGTTDLAPCVCFVVLFCVLFAVNKMKMT